MSFFKNIFGGATISSIMNPAPPTYTTTTTSSTSIYPVQGGYFQAVQNGYFANAQALQQGTGGLMGAGMSKTPEAFRIDQDLLALQRYTDACGDVLDIVEIENGEEVTDVNVALIRIAPIGKIVKGVGMRLSDNKYAVVREAL